MANQTTLKESAILEGTGLHTGKPCRARLKKAPKDSGIFFTAQGKRISAGLNEITDTKRGTTLGHNGIQVRTVEHCLSSLRGLGVDNAEIEVDGGELPSLDGSAAGYAQAIEKAGIAEIAGSVRPRWTFDRAQSWTWRQGRTQFRVSASPEFRLKVTLAYPGTVIDQQSAEYAAGESYVERVSRARTFCLEEEIVALQASGLALGGSLDNAVVVGKTKLQAKDGLRYPDELARHKLLDLLGDLSLIGLGEFVFSVEAVAPGHTANAAFAKELVPLLHV